MIICLLGFGLTACHNATSMATTTIQQTITTEAPSSIQTIVTTQQQETTTSAVPTTFDPSIEIYSEVYMPGIIETYYPTAEILVADRIIIRSTRVDPTGVNDSTEGIQSVLDLCSQNGGGTVFLPRGKYRITGNIRIPSFVYLQGDYNDPDAENFNGYYGTVILADVPEAEVVTKSTFMADKEDPNANFPALITIGGSAGVIGLTVYYPNQDPDNIKPYPFTFEIPSFAGVGGSINHMAATIKNVTMINAYKGVAASVTPASDGKSAANEMLHLENIKGTVLYQGFQLYNSSETGIIRDISLSPLYWFGASSGYNSPEYEKINTFSKTYGIGVLLGDLEWNTFTNIHVSGYRIGVRIHDGLRRYIPGQPEIYFIGQFYNLNIDDCFTGLRVDNMYINMGINITKGEISGSTYAINAPYVGTSRIKLVGVTLEGEVRGANVYQSYEPGFAFLLAEGLLKDVSIPYPTKRPANFVDVVKTYKINNTGTTDVSATIQSVLNQVGFQGGGIVYLKAGQYRLDSPLVVPANTELRGAASANTRDQIGLSQGTVLMANYGYQETKSAAETAQSLITLAGDHAGVSGMRVVYYDNPPLLGDKVSFKLHSYVIRAQANHNYVTYMSFFGVPYGIEFKGDTKLDGGLILGVNATYYEKGINIVNVEEMIIEECLSNASVVARSNFVNMFPEFFSEGWPRDGATMTKMYDDITRPNSKFLNVTDSQVKIGNSFTFGSFAFFTGINSDIFIYNSAGDNLSNLGHLIEMNGGALVGLNIMRYQGTVIRNINDNASITVINRLSLHQNTDNDVVSNIQVAPMLIASSLVDVDDLPQVYTRP